MNESPHPVLGRASCACSAVSMAFSAKPYSVIHCHCGLCRRLSGAAFSTWVSFKRGDVEWKGHDMLCTFAPTSNTLRHFCRHCGTHVLTVDARYPDIVGIPAGILADGLPAVPQGHYFVDHKASWYSIADTLERYGGHTGYEPVTTNARQPSHTLSA